MAIYKVSIYYKNKEKFKFKYKELDCNPFVFGESMFFYTSNQYNPIKLNFLYKRIDGLTLYLPKNSKFNVESIKEKCLKLINGVKENGIDNWNIWKNG